MWGALRFLVAMGVGGEWAVGAALVAEVFPKHARGAGGRNFSCRERWAGSGSQAAAGLVVGTQWRRRTSWHRPGVAWCYGCVVSIRNRIRGRKLRADEGGVAWEASGTAGPIPSWRSRAVGGALLAMVGLGHVLGRGRCGSESGGGSSAQELGAPRATFPIAAKIAFWVHPDHRRLHRDSSRWARSASWLGRRRTFAWMHVAAFVMTPVVCWVPAYVGS
jgi:hypothetical protein